MSGQTATPPSVGDGSETTPYEISTLDNLYWLSQNSSEWDKYYIQTADIDASTTSTWDDGDGGDADGFVPIGNSTTLFTGKYNGQNYTVSNLYINRPATDNVALFGNVTNATIDSLGVVSADVTGHNNAAALVGFNNTGSSVSRCYSTGSISGVSSIAGLVGVSFATVSECYSTADINATEHNNGGLIGYCLNATTTNSYSRGSVTAGGNNTGGLIGVNDGGCTVENCFSTGTVSGAGQDPGGFVGDNNGGTITNSFWDITTSGMTESWGGTGLPTDEMKNMITFLNAGWDFVDETVNGTNEYWSFNSVVNDGYPFLNFQGNSRENRLVLLTDSVDNIFINGATAHFNIVYLGDNNPTAYGVCWNTAGNPTLSDNFTDEGGTSSSGNFSSDITGLSANTTYHVRAYATDTDGTTYGDDLIFKTYSAPSAGDGTEGNPYEISSLANLTWLSQTPEVWGSYFTQTADIDASTTSTWDDGDGGDADGFLPVGNNAIPFTGEYNGNNHIISDLFIYRPNNDTIGLFGHISNASIENLGVENATISGQIHTGVLVGLSNAGSLITHCYTSGSVDGVSGSGGLAGTSFSVVSECYSTADINATEHNNGGLIGYCLNATTNNSYSRGSVTAGGNNNGGLIGVNDGNCTIDNCFSTGAVSDGVQDIGGFIGDNDGGTITNSFWDVTTSGMTTSAGGTGLATEEMKNMVTYLNVGWDFIDETLNGTNEYWSFNSVVNDGYPFLNFQGDSREDRLVLLTDSINNITENNAIAYANVIYLGTDNPTAHGVCWNTTGNPTIGDDFSDEGAISSTGSFSSAMTGLSANTTYYVRSYATDTDGTKYGDEMVFTTYNTPSIGDGTEENPYQISSLANLSWFMQTPEVWDSYFIQTDDIDASSTSAWNGGEGWSPVGNGDVNFSGSYDGQGHLISNLFINRSEYYQGLFGILNYAEIKNLGMENIDITADKRTGAIAGSVSSSVIEYCYSTGNITSGSSRAGGIVGENNYDGKIINCYSRCAVSGTYNIGGISGNNGNLCEIINCYSTGTISGISSIGGITGYGVIVEDCFWDTMTSGIGTSDGGTGKTTTEMTDLDTFTDTTTAGLDEAWDFTGYANDDYGTASIWEIDAGLNNGYPTLSWQYASTASIVMHAIDSINTTEAYLTCIVTNTGGADVTAAGVCWNTTGTPDVSDNTSDEGVVTGTFNTTMTGLSAGAVYYVRAYATNSEGTTYGTEIAFKTTPASGSGTETDPYEISSLEELAWLMGNQNVWDQHFIQTANIDASGTQSWFANKGFDPLGTSISWFTGSYNGKGYSIDGLSIYRTDQENLALFGRAVGASFDSIVITNISVVCPFGETAFRLGSIVGHGDDVNISNCSSTGFVSGSSGTGGGIAGVLYTSYIENCSSNCTINSSQVGGLIGYVGPFSVIKSCSSDGSVSGNNRVGGLIGSCAADTIINCFSNASVTGQYDYTGGLIGDSDYEIYMSNCYSTSIVEGDGYVGGLFGRLSGYAYIEECYSEGTVNGAIYVGGLIGASRNGSTIMNCYSHASATASSSSVGGLIGNHGLSSVYNCYSTGSVSGSTYAGGLIGASMNSTVENCFWNTETSGFASSSGGTGKTTAELKDTTTFTHETTNGLTTAWDFFKNPGDDNAYADVWHIDPVFNSGYPFFVREIIADVQTLEATNIGVDTLTSGGVVINEGSTSVTERGLCWSITSPPMLTDNKIQVGAGLGEFSENLTELDTSTTYYIRAYAINAYDTAFGLIDTVTTLKASQTITFNTIADKIYGDEPFELFVSTNSGLSISYSSSDPAVAEVLNGTVTINGVGTTNITASQAGSDTYYAADDVVQTLTVVKDTVWVTAHDITKLYGETNPELTYSYTEFAYDEDSTVIDVQPVISTTVDASTNAGTEEITISGAEDDNYYFYHVNGTFTINKDTLTVTAHNKNRAYGEDNPDFTMNYSGFANGEDYTVIDEEPIMTTNADNLSDVGIYAITLSGGTDNNYAFEFVDGELTVNKAMLVANAGNYYKFYGDVNPEIVIQYTGFQNDEDSGVLDELPIASTSANEYSDVGNYDVTLSGGSDNNYEISLFNGLLTVQQATLSVQAVDTSRNYNEPNPEFRIEYAGFVNDENISVLDQLPVAYTTASVDSDAGVYPITLSGGSDNNYFLAFLDGYLTINKLDQEISFNLPDSVSLETEYIEISASTNTGLNITYETSDASVAYVDGNLLYTVSVGTCTISAIQEGNVNYNPARVDLAFKVYSGNSIFSNYELSDFKIYPNPVEDVIIIQNSKDIDCIEVCNLSGKPVKQFKPVTNSLHVSELKSGVYLLKIYGDDIKTVLKIIKK